MTIQQIHCRNIINGLSYVSWLYDLDHNFVSLNRCMSPSFVYVLIQLKLCGKFTNESNVTNILRDLKLIEYRQDTPHSKKYCSLTPLGDYLINHVNMLGDFTAPKPQRHVGYYDATFRPHGSNVADNMFIIMATFCVCLITYEFYGIYKLSWLPIIYSLSWVIAIGSLIWLNFFKNPIEHQTRPYYYVDNHAYKTQSLSKKLGLSIREPDLINPLLDSSCIRFIANNSNPKSIKPQYRHLYFHNNDLKRIFTMKPKRSNNFE